MYERLIKEISPKPLFNLKWYKGKDLYSEGEIEDIIIDIIANNEPEDYVQAIKNKFSWSTYYHLTHTRKNILNWYPFEQDASVLEIGCGMGAITNLLCEKCKEVTAVELSQKRAIGTLLRCREMDNLEIIVGNLNDIKFEKKFDYITLIGVLEYQGNYTDTENPYADFLKKIKQLLKPEGKLLIAIENQYGLKYWCGAREDHTSIPFDGMNQYKLSNGKVRTFSKEELRELVRKCGFRKSFFYYPMPDYKLPEVIYSEEVLPKNENMMNMQYYYIPNTSTLVANEKFIYKDLIKNKVFDFFANSFLVECTEEGDVGEITFISLSSARFPEYRIGIRFRKQGEVEKFSLSKNIGENHLLQILNNEQDLLKAGVNIIKNRKGNGVLVSEYVNMPTMEDVLLEAYYNKDIQRINEIWDKVYQEILNSSQEALWEDNILYLFEISNVQDKEKYGKILKNGYVDMILRNAFYKEEIFWFDQEWMIENIPAKFILFRAINEFYYSFKEICEVYPVSMLAQRYEMVIMWNEFKQLEKVFAGTIVDMDHMKEVNSFNGNVAEDIIKNIKLLINKK